MADRSHVAGLLLAAVFCVQFAVGCETDDAHPIREACTTDACLPDGGEGGATDSGSPAGSGDGGIGNGGSAGAVEGGSPNGGSGGDPQPSDLESRIDRAIESIQADSCFSGDDTSLCEWADYEVGAHQFDMARSTHEALLLIDDFSAGFYPELVRYRNRLLGVYRVDGDQVVLQVLSVHLPQRLGDALISFAGPEFISARALARVGAAVNASYGKLNLLYYAHGGVVFAHAVELVPEQPLVLLDLNHFLDIPPSVCSGIDPQTLAAATAHFSALTSSLKQIMSEQNVRFINASFGSTVPNLAVDWARTCGTELPSGEQLQALLHVYDPVYDLLFDSEGVVTAQAAANLGSPADYPFDQVSPKYPNRVRVGFFSSRNSGLDEIGRGDVEKTDQFPVPGDADVYLNWGCEMSTPAPLCAEPHYEFAAPFGFGTATVPLMSTSYVDPLGIARLINLRYSRHDAEPMSNALIQTLRQELTPALCGDSGSVPCAYQDPIAHRQLELYRLGYE